MIRSAIFTIIWLATLVGAPALAQTNVTQGGATVDIGTDTDAVAPLPWQVCNDTSFILKVASVMVTKGQAGQPLRGRGWMQLRPGACQIMDAEKGTPRYVYARSSAVHHGGIREWKGEHDFCVSTEKFTASTDISCALQNMQSAKFLSVLPTEQRTAFTEPAAYGARAETAGIQRLLSDNNYAIKRIDGVGGRRTSKTLNKFFTDKKLGKLTNIEDIFAALESAAQSFASEIGVTFCNQTDGRVWTAIAHKRSSGATHHMQAQGWWPINPGSCLRPYSGSTQKSPVYYYARLETPAGPDQILKTPSGTSASYCIGEGKFASIRHEYCEDRGYVAARFAAISSESPGAKINFTAADFTEAAMAQLRQ